MDRVVVLKKEHVLQLLSQGKVVKLIRSRWVATQWGRRRGRGIIRLPRASTFLIFATHAARILVMPVLSSRLGLIQPLLLLPRRSPTKRREGQQKVLQAERLVAQPLAQSLATRAPAPQSERRRVQSGVVDSKRKLTSRQNSKPNNRGRLNSSKP